MIGQTILHYKILEKLGHYYSQNANGQPILPNSDFLNPISYQPPFTARLGLEVNF